ASWEPCRRTTARPKTETKTVQLAEPDDAHGFGGPLRRPHRRGCNEAAPRRASVPLPSLRTEVNRPRSTPPVGPTGESETSRSDPRSPEPQPIVRRPESRPPYQRVPRRSPAPSPDLIRRSLTPEQTSDT